MNAVMQWTQSEMGRRMIVWASGALSLAVQGGLIPLDYAIGPWSVGQLLAFFGLGVAATAGSTTRR
jgi:hypothetical protein